MHIGPDSVAESTSKRPRLHPCRYKWVRRIKGRYQARPWVGPEVGGPINLGLYKHEYDAWAAIRVWVAAGCRPDEGLPEGILPKWVVQNADGSFSAKGRYAGRTLLVKPRKTASEAFQAAYAKVQEIRKQDGPLPRGVVVRGSGYACRFWAGGRVVTLNGPYLSPAEACIAIAGRAPVCPRIRDTPPKLLKIAG